jgi:hypothetical protein
LKTKNEYRYILTKAKKIKAVNFFGGKCQKCNENRFWLLSFHHRDTKDKEKFRIGRIKDYRWSTIEKELVKCDLLCERCHRELHNYNTTNRSNQSKNMLLDMKLKFSCELCGYDKCIGALDFHHNENKTFNIGKIIIHKNSKCSKKEQILIEVQKCTILCPNCHRDLHFDKERFEKYKKEIYNWGYKEYKQPLHTETVMRLHFSGMRQIDIARYLDRNKSVICGIIKKYKNSLEWVTPL